MIIKTKFKCKGTSQIGSGMGKSSVWYDQFIEGKWYDGEYETWTFDDGYRLNGGWRRYWVIDERGKKKEIPKAHMQAIFYLDLDKVRNEKIDEILK